MKVQINDYVITSDQNQFTLNKVSIVKTGKRKGEENLVVIGYYPRLEQLAVRLMELELSNSDAKTISDMLTCIRATRKLIKTAGWTKEDIEVV